MKPGFANDGSEVYFLLSINFVSSVHPLKVDSCICKAAQSMDHDIVLQV